MTDHCDDLVVDQLLRDLRRRTRVGCVVLRVELQRDLLAADRQALGVDFFNCQARAVFVVLAQVSDTAGQRCNVTDLDDRRRLQRVVANDANSIAAALIGNSF